MPGRRRSIRGSTARRGGFYSSDKYWIENLDIPLGYIRNYITQLKKGVKIERPTAEIAAERDRIIAEYAALLGENVRPVFEQKLGLARTVFPYSRTTTSTSSTGRSACSGARCVSSAACSSGAEAVGINTVHFDVRQPAEMIAEIRARLGLLPQA
jgi:predicted metal-binding protein